MKKNNNSLFWYSDVESESGEYGVYECETDRLIALLVKSDAEAVVNEHNAAIYKAMA